MSITFKEAGSKASNQYGQFTVRHASIAQQNYIRKLLDEREHDLGELDPSTVNVQNASHIIDQLLRSPVRPDRIAPASDKQLAYIEALRYQRDGADAFLSNYFSQLMTIGKLTAPDAKKLIDTLLQMPMIVRQVAVDVGAYRYNGELYSVRKARESGRMHAHQWNSATNIWEFARGVVYELRPEMKLTLAEAMDYGVQTGVCIHCGRTLTDAKSVRYGIGPHCRKFYQ